MLSSKVHRSSPISVSDLESLYLIISSAVVSDGLDQCYRAGPFVPSPSTSFPGVGGQHVTSCPHWSGGQRIRQAISYTSVSECHKLQKRRLTDWASLSV